MYRTILTTFLATALLAGPAASAETRVSWWPDTYEVAKQQDRTKRQDELTPEQRRALHEYLNRHADTDGDGDFDADDIQQIERTGDLSMLADSDLMGGYFGSGDEFIRDGVEHEVNGGRYLRGARDRQPEDGDRVARLDLFGMRGFLSDEGTYTSPSEETASSHFSHWRMQVAQLLPGYIPPADYTELLERIEAEEQPEPEPAREHRPRYSDDDPTVWW